MIVVVGFLHVRAKHATVVHLVIKNENILTV